MAVLKDSDFFPFDDYSARLKGMEADTEAFASSTANWIGKVKASYKEAQDEARQLQTEIGSFNTKTNDATSIMAAYERKINDVAGKLETARQSEKDLTDAQKLNAQVVTDLTAKLASLQQRFLSLDPTQKSYEKQQRAILNEVRTVTRAIDAQSKSLQIGKSAMDSAENSAAGLRKQTSELKQTLDRLPDAYDKATGKLNEQNRAAVALNNQYQKNIELLNKIEQGQRVFTRNVGNYPKPEVSGASAAKSALGVGTSIVGAGLALAGVDTALGAIQKVGEVTLQFDSLDSALKVVSNDTALLTQRQAMLSAMSNRLGQDVSVVEKNYTNLTASSKGTRLEGAATDEIFSKVVGTMARLKKPAEDVDGALLAIGQIMSKGTVQSEELRGQLGERLPGAFNIAAKAMGVTTSKLSDMLKNGEVVASEFLPKFADELEKTFNPEHEQRVEGLAANLARLRNEGVEWVKSLDIGGTAGEWIGNITQMSRSVREFFAPAVETASNRLAEQTDKVNNLEAALPDLLGRYDELTKKTNLSAKEQSELQTIMNGLARLVPSAATEFDWYGNAVSISRDKVAEFTIAQRAMNKELEQAAIQAQRAQTSVAMSDATKSLYEINSRKREQTTNYGMGVYRTQTVTLQDSDVEKTRTELQKQNKVIEQSLTERLRLGDKLDQSEKNWIQFSGSEGLKQYKAITDINDKIADLTQKQGSLLLKADKKSLAEREGVLKQLKEYQDKKQTILNPKLEPDTSSDKPEQSQAAINKARAAAEKALRDSLSLTKANSDRNLAKLNDDHQDGLLTEQDFIEKRLQVTLNGLNKRQEILSKAGKKETDDYVNVLRDKEKAETDYQRAQLQLDLKNNKSQADTKVAGLDPTSFTGGENDLAYVEARHKILSDAAAQDLRIIAEAGQGESELYKQAYQRQLDEQTDYQRRRVKSLEASHKRELSEVKQAMAQLNRERAGDLQERLNELDHHYRQEEEKIKVAVKTRKLSAPEGEAKLYALRLSQLKEEASTIQSYYQKEQDESNAVVNARIADLQKVVDDSTASEKEISDAKEAIRQLEETRDKQAAENRRDLSKAVAKNEKDTDDTTTKHKLDNAEKLKQKSEAYLQLSLQLADTLGNATFSIISSNVEREGQTLDKQHDQELKLAGDNADAKNRIEEQYQRRKAELARKSAVAERDQALFSIAINTAMGVASVLSTGGGTHYLDLGISAGILTAFVVAAGIAQAAAVLAKPLPAFAGGKLATDTYTGPALAGEAGAELLVDREGYAQLLGRPTIINTRAGDRIYTANETQAILSEGRAYGDTANRLRQGRLNEQIFIHQHAGASGPSFTEEQLTRAFGKALDERPADITIHDERGVRRGQKRGNSITEYLDKRYRY